MSIDRDNSDPGRDRDGEAERTAAELREQMDRLKARYRVERRLLETRSYRPKKS